MKACRDCVWWDKNKYTSTAGFCRKGTPQPANVEIKLAISGVKFANIWPMTKPEDWCGEWKQKEVVH